MLERNGKKRAAGFTMVELLVVVAIIAILAAIAIPNFLQSASRSKVSRVKADLRSMAAALEAYHSDQNAYPLCNKWGVGYARATVAGDPPVLERITTPTAYMTSIPHTPYVATRISGPNVAGIGPIEDDLSNWPPIVPLTTPAGIYDIYGYSSTGESAANTTGIARAQNDLIPEERVIASAWILQTSGPQLAHINMGGVIANADKEYSANLLYDPTNGAVSFGNIFRVGGNATGTNNFYDAVTMQEK